MVIILSVPPGCLNLATKCLTTGRTIATKLFSSRVGLQYRRQRHGRRCSGKARDGRRLCAVDTTLRDFGPSAWRIGNYEPVAWNSSKNRCRSTTTGRVFRCPVFSTFRSFFGWRSILKDCMDRRRLLALWQKIPEPRRLSMNFPRPPAFKIVISRNAS